MNYNPRDHFFKKAKKENFAARSVFKLEEIDQKFKLFKPGQFVIDLGASPGSWSQYASKKVGPKGGIFGIDLTAITIKLDNAVFMQADIHNVDFPKELTAINFPEQADLVLSDMAPKTTGIRITDQARSYELCQMALGVARAHLRKGGHFVCKFFHSSDFKALQDEIKKTFERCEQIKPEATREISKEIFLVGLRKK